MFALLPDGSLFAKKYTLVEDKKRGGVWAIYKKGIAFYEYPYRFEGWHQISEEEFAAKYPKHYKCFKHHQFIIEAGEK